MSIWLRDVALDGRRADVMIDDGSVVGIRPVGAVRPRVTDTVVEAGGGWLLPGLHDHHVHLLSLAASHASVDCSPDAARDLAALGAALREHQHADGWVRGVGHHEAATGPLDRHVLDRLEPSRPVRVQHRGGALWVLNSLALQRVAHLLDDSDDVERDAQGEPTGRLWRYDARLASGLPTRPPDLAAVGRELRALGITGVTDATPELEDAAATLLAEAAADGRLPVTVTALGGGTNPPAPLLPGPAKVMLRDHDLPSFDELVTIVTRHRGSGRAVAVHCVTVESLVLTLAAIEAVGPVPGDRIEHAAVLPRTLLDDVKRLGLRVVVQPDFVRTRGAQYLEDVDPIELPDLCPHGRLLDAGIPTTCSSDAPFGTLDPWQVIATASTRRTHDGRLIGADDAVRPARSIEGYLSAAHDPGGPPRRVEVGAVADLLLLHVGRDAALAAPHRDLVRASLRGDDLRLAD